jgi:uncharacterized membrane protein YqjE
MATQTDLQSQTDPSFSSLVQGIVQDFQNLIRQQLHLFKVEMENDLKRTRNASLPLAAGGIVLFVGTLVLAIGLSELLYWAVPDLPRWAAYVIVGGVITVVGGALAYLGYQKFQTFNPLPDVTLDALKENLQWPTKT